MLTRSFPAAPASTERPHPFVWAVVAAAAIAWPMLLAVNYPPSSTFLNQAAALIGWGALLVVLAASLNGRTLPHGHGLVTLLAALLLLAAFVSPFWTALPWSLALSALAMIAAAMIAVLAGTALQHEGLALPAFRALCVGMVVAGALSGVVGMVQVFAPNWPDGDWIARSGIAGRAVGNLRQPNHLATLLLWSAVSVVPLVESGALARSSVRRAAATALMALMVLGVTLSGSRTGLIGIGVLALWGIADRRLSRFSRSLLLAAPLFCAASWALTAWWASTHGAHAIGAAARVGEGDLSASRFAIWRDTLTMIAQQPWLGVGFGEFNFAWTLTPLPDRPVAFFDHTHNLPLQLAVELGVPLALVVLGLLGTALWQAGRRSWAVQDDTGPGLRAAFVMVLLMALHSQLEYPLWYAHFLLPTAFMWGLCLGAGASAPAAVGARRARWPIVAGAAMVVAAVAVVVDYHRVVVVFEPPAGAKPLEERIADGQRSWFFAHHADYAAATTAAHPADVLPAFKRATHHLLDTRLMIAWANALAQSGDVDKARHLAARLREFRNPNSESFFAPCAVGAPEPRPFQCEPPERVYSWRDFR